jgi:hypothetical protein
MSLGAKVVNLIRLHIIDQVAQLAAVAQVSVVQEESAPRVVRIGIDMLNSIRIEGARPSNQAMDFIALSEKPFCQIRSILSRDPCDERLFHSPPGRFYFWLVYAVDMVVESQDINITKKRLQVNPSTLRDECRASNLGAYLPGRIGCLKTGQES